MCDEVKVPWERVFVHDDALLSRDIYIKTPGHCFGNHQSNVRFWSKMRLHRRAGQPRSRNATGADQVPAVRETLGRIPRSGGDDRRHDQRPDQGVRELAGRAEGYVSFNRRMMYAALKWCTQNYSKFVDKLRELWGGGVFQMPANVSVMHDPELRAPVRDLLADAAVRRAHRMKLFKLAWDMVGSEFAGRHQQYEKFYAGASFIIRNHHYREADWDGVQQDRRRSDGELRPRRRHRQARGGVAENTTSS